MFFELFNDLLQTRVLLTEFYPSMNVAAKEHRGERIPGLALTMDVKRRSQETNGDAVVGCCPSTGWGKGLTYLYSLFPTLLTSLKLVK